MLLYSLLPVEVYILIMAIAGIKKKYKNDLGLTPYVILLIIALE